MKITIEPTGENKNFAEPQQTVTIQVPSDDIQLHQAVELLRGALIAYGYQEQHVQIYIAAQ